MPNIVVVNDSKEKTAPGQDDLDAKPKEEVTAPQELVKFVVPMSRQSNRLEVGVKEGGGGGKNAETPLIDKDPMVNCPTENIDWAALTLVTYAPTLLPLLSTLLPHLHHYYSYHYL